MPNEPMTETPGVYNLPEATATQLNTKLDTLIKQIDRLTEGVIEIRLTAQAQAESK